MNGKSPFSFHPPSAIPRPPSTVPRLLFTVLCLLSTVFCLPSSDLHAGTLTIETKTTISVAGDLLKISVTYTNKGDATAQNLQVHLVFSEDSLQGPIKPQLDPGQSDTVEFEKKLTGFKKGRHPLGVRVDFHDTNQYPFSALSGLTFHYLEDVNSDLVARAGDLPLTKEGKLEYDIKNLGEEARNIRATLMLPKEFTTPRTRTDLLVEPRSAMRLVYDVSNFAAIDGASYPVFCFLEYDRGETHHAQVARAVIKVLKKETWFRRYRTAWIILAGMLLAAFMVVVVRHRPGKPGRSPRSSG